MANDLYARQSTEDLTGRTLGQYQIQEQLGQGGMATVYKALQKSIGRTVAIKVMPSYFMHEPTFMQRFEREVKVIAELQHPRVLPVYDYGQIEGRPFIVMAYMSGGTLSDRIQKGPLSLEESVRIMEQIAEGLDHAHRKGIIHRDFKPSNVLLDDHGNAYLSDFGIAKVSESTVQLTGSGVVGTPAYMAPEMASYAQVTPAVDIYAMGVTLYQMLTGTLPFKGETPLSVMMAHASEPVPDVRVVRPDVPESIAEVVKRALAKNPQDRYVTAGQMAKALEAAVAGIEPERATQVPASQRPTQPMPAVSKPPTPPTQPPTGAPGGWQAPAAGTPSPTPQPSIPAPQPLTPPPPPPKSGGGCRWGVVGALIGGLVVVAMCIGGVLLIAQWGASLTPTPTITLLPTNTPQPTNPPAPTPVPQGGSGSTDLVIQNESSTPVCYVYVSPNESDEWGEDQLGEANILMTGDTFTVTDVPYGLYDYQALDCDSNVLDQHYGVDLSTDTYTWVIRDKTATLTVINNTSYPLCMLRFSTVEDTIWAVNYLEENETLQPGQQRSFPISPGTYDMRADGCDEVSFWEDYEFAITTSFEWSLFDEDRQVK